MKTAFLNTVLCSLMLLAAACGKSGGGGSGVNTYTSNLTNVGLSATSQQSLVVAANWYASNIEGTSYLGTYKVTRTPYSYNTAQTCEERHFLGIPYQYCTTNGTPVSGTPVVQPFVVLMQDGVVISAKGNTELNTIFSGAAGTLISATSSGSRIQMDFLRADKLGITSYVIDTSAHSLLNPISKTETTESSKIVTQVSATRIY
jgi:hypothetical protein